MPEPIQSFDNFLLEWIQANLRTEFLDAAMPFVTALGNAGLIWLIAGITLICIKKYRLTGFAVLTCLVLYALIGTFGLKPLIARLRPSDLNPDMVLLIPRPTDYSFPSGHTAASFAAATAMLWNHKRLGACAMLLAAAIAFSRLYLYVHYPTDILAGILLGIGIGAAAVSLCNAVKNRRS